MCPTRHFVYIFFNPVFQVSTAKNEINLFNNHILIVAPVTFAPAGAMTPSAEFLFQYKSIVLFFFLFLHENICCGYSLEVLSEALLMSTHNIYLHEEIRKIFTHSYLKPMNS